MQLDHIGLAVQDIENTSKFWTEAMGYQLTLEEDVPSMAVRVQKLTSHGTTIELLQPTGNEGAIAKFLQKRGPGIHHLSFHIENIEEATARFAALGYKALYPQPRVGAGGCLVNFFHPKDTHGVLIEIAQEPSA